MNNETGHLLDEDDIGSGEKDAGQRDTEKEIDKIGEANIPGPGRNPDAVQEKLKKE